MLSLADLNKFHAILMMKGYHLLPHTEWYWEKEDDVGILLVYNFLSRNGFENIKWYNHFAGNDNLNTNDKFAKVKKLSFISKIVL